MEYILGIYAVIIKKIQVYSPARGRHPSDILQWQIITFYANIPARTSQMSSNFYKGDHKIQWKFPLTTTVLI